MKKFLIVALGMLATAQVATAQDDLFGTEKKEKKNGLIIGASTGVDIPMGDMAERFGASFRIGPSLTYKTNKGWVFGAKWDYLFGNIINEPGFLSNLKSDKGGVLVSSGYRNGLVLNERGYLIGLQAGKIFSFKPNKPDIGILALTTVGFMQHKILISTGEKNIPQLEGEYVKGYDRLANGLFIEEFVGYNHFSASGLFNFSAGVNVLAGFTQGRRDYLYDVMKPGNEKRFDMLTGIRLNWYIPAFKRKSEDYYFE